MSTRNPLLCLLVVCLPLAAQAARPFVTDDARLVDAGGCQVETFVKRQQKVDEREFGFLPACNPWGGVELTLGGTWITGAAPGDSRVAIMQAKTLLKPLDTNGTGYAIALGAGQVTPFQARRTLNPYLNAIGSFSFADDFVVIHANVGAIHDRQLGMTRATWGIGAEIELNPRVYGIVETYGQRAEKPTRHFGLRIWMVPSKVQIDGTLGAQRSGPPERAFSTLGVRILF
jgi:hypothetical protein